MTRLGLHLISNRAGPQAIDYIRQVQPNVCKFLGGDRDLIGQALAVSPKTIWIGRVVWNPQTFGSYGDFQKRTLAVAREHRGLVTAWEGYNEVAWRGEDLRTFARAEAGLAKRLNDEGFTACIGGFSTGFLETDEDFDYFRQALEYLHENPSKAWLHFHEYAAPYVQYFVRTPDGRNQWDHAAGSWTGFSDDPQVYYDPALDGWLTLRYRMLRWKLESEGLGNVRFVITESGIDGGVVPRPGPQGGGWRDFDGAEWKRIVGDYAEQMRWYLWQISHDPYVVGAVDFGFGTIDGKWDSFDLAQDPAMLARMIAKMRELPVGLITEAEATPMPTPTPLPAPVTVPTDGPEPRVLVRQGDGWYALVRRCGKTADAANVAALKAANPTVTALEPGQWLPEPVAQGGAQVRTPVGTGRPAPHRLRIRPRKAASKGAPRTPADPA